MNNLVQQNSSFILLNHLMLDVFYAFYQYSKNSFRYLSNLIFCLHMLKALQKLKK